MKLPTALQRRLVHITGVPDPSNACIQNTTVNYCQSKKQTNKHNILLVT